MSPIEAKVPYMEEIKKVQPDAHTDEINGKDLMDCEEERK